MKGTYRVYSDGQLIAEQPNLITTQGGRLILRYLAGDIPRIGGAIAVGTSNVQPAVSNTKLGFEFSRSATDFTSVNYTLNQVFFKAPMDTAASGLIYELGLYPLLGAGSEFNSLVLSGFEPSLEPLTGGTENFVNARIGASSYGLTAAASGSATATLTTSTLDLSGYSPLDTFSLGYFTNDANAATISVRLYTDAVNYFTSTFAPSTIPNYYVNDMLKSSFVATGAANWANITSIGFIVTAGSGGSTTVQLDGFRVNSTNTVSEYALVSRSVLSTPIIKRLNQQMDIEYVLEFNV